MAQSGTASIGGTVFDRQNQLISGAAVTLSNSSKGFSRTAITNESGTFSFPGIEPGVYRLKIDMNGFKKFIQTDVLAIIDTPTEISAVLEIGDINETVNVISDSVESLRNTQDATIGNPFNSNQVTQLPTEARAVINLLTLQPGVTRFGYVVGGRSDQSNITLDGVDVNNPIFNQISSPNLRLNAEAIEEFRVTINNPNAAQGRSSGAQVSLVTKSGTNEFRGALFLTGRRTEWSANDFFNNRAGVERPKFDRNVFGGAIGGPVWKNRAFFFYSFEGERTVKGETILRVVPLPNLGQGIVRFRADTGQTVSLNCSQLATIFPATNGCNSAALAVFAAAAARYPANSFEEGDGLNTAGFRFNADNKIKNNSQVLRLDFNPSARQQMFFRANYINDLETQAPQFPDTPAPIVWSHPTGFVVGLNWTASKNIFNNFRFGLTRQSRSTFGDSSDNSISFTNVYSPRLPNKRSNSAIDSVANFSDDLSFIRRAHTFQFGVNIRLIRSRLQSYARSYDSAATTPGAFAGGGNSITNPINLYLRIFCCQIAREDRAAVQSAASALIGRFSTYQANFNFLRNGLLQPPGTPRERDFRSEEYDFYASDVWKIRPALTATFGLRYGLSRPIYEANGYEVKPTLNLSEYFKRRADGAANGAPYNEPIILDLSGAANGRSPLYKWDVNNFQPRVALAWSPDFGNKKIGWLLGRSGESVIRGGFSVTNDYLAIFLMAGYDNLNSLGFRSGAPVQNLAISVAPAFTGFNQNIRALPNIVLPVGNLTFPRQAPDLVSQAAAEFGLDENLSAPTHYNWSLTYERILPAGLIVSVSYLGRQARNLLQPRDTAAIANFVDTQSGMDWNTAATRLEMLRQQNTPISQIPQILYFANLFPPNLSALLGCNPDYHQTQAVYSLVFTGGGACGRGIDWVNVQLNLSRLSTRFPGQHIFFQPQYGSYRGWSSIGKSAYQGLSFTIRQRLGTRLVTDFNYTFSRSEDDGSGLFQGGLNSPTALIINPFRQDEMFAASDFDMRHIVNANWIFRLPIGRGEPIFGNAGKFADLILGGWQLAGIFRYNTGLPISTPRDNGKATSWNVASYTTRTSAVQNCPTRGGGLFGCNILESYRSFRNAFPGETGERNVFRLPSFWALDLGFGKTFDLPWDNHKFQFRWEIFNLANTQKMGDIDLDNYKVGLDPQTASQVPANFANFISIQGNPRSMQFVLRYSF